MRRPATALLLAAALCTLAAGEAANDTSADEANSTDTSIMFLEESPAPADLVVTRRLTHLALGLQRVLRRRPGAGRTLLFSPLSVSAVLHLLWLGARGRTAEELASLLGSGPDPGPGLDEVLPSVARLTRRLYHSSAGTRVDVASAMFLQYGYPVLKGFADTSRNTFNTEVYGAEFAAGGDVVAGQINGWVSSKTKHRINKLFDQALPPDTKVLLVSAIYFNGEWEYPFPAETTFKRPFTIPRAAGEPPELLQLHMMSNSGDLPYARSDELGCRAVGLPYKGGQVVMYLVQPLERGLEAFSALEGNLTVERVDSLLGSLQETPVIVSVPRMRIQSTFHLRGAVEQLGARALFDPLEADLGRMSPGGVRPLDDNSTVQEGDNPGLYVGDLVHKVEIEVTETGTVASAVAAATVTRDGSRVVLRFDRPFLFFIRHEPTGLLMFWGSVMRPVT
ncbi:serine protease inhibitor 28Dc-like [Bacillus rossius redtenbacheri]|uniref:serine protease inhibitor 28Dc-like n=1 Tax=Bacillus rossius redtenbacheri TaxID=93214 RepID=UPI002FDCAB5D